MYWVRWVLFIPGALVGAVVVHILYMLINRLGMSMYWMNPDSLFAKLFLVPAASGLMGASFVYIGTYIAPEKKKLVAVILGGVLLVLSGFLLFPAIWTVDLWAIVADVAMNIGSVIVVLSILHEEIDSLVERNGRESSEY
jgi:hypothetical protein